VHSHRTCEAVSSLFRHLSHMDLFNNSNLKMCPFRWQYPVSSPVIHLCWFQFNSYSSLVLFVEDPCMFVLLQTPIVLYGLCLSSPWWPFCNSYWDTTFHFSSHEWTFNPILASLLGVSFWLSFPVTKNWYQLNSHMFSQFPRGLVINYIVSLHKL
jgi:hypothetical protein